MKSLFILTSTLLAAGINAVVPATQMFWSREPDLPGAGLSSVGAVTRGEYIYIFGRSGDNTDEVVHRYNAETKVWDTVTKRPLAGNHPCGVMYQDKLWVFGGRYHYSPGSTQVYDFVNDKWEVKSYFGGPGTGKTDWLAGAVSCGLINDKVYIAGGEVDGELGAYPYTAMYDLATDKWSYDHPNMPTPVHHATWFVWDNELWIMGGRISGQEGKDGVATTQIYNPQTKSWRTSDQDHQFHTILGQKQPLDQLCIMMVNSTSSEVVRSTANTPIQMIFSPKFTF
jgi:hypothetical protein